MEQHERLRQYNRWRRGTEDWAPDERGPDPKELGELIDGAADRLEVLERERQEFFERWHGERRKREKLAADVERCYRMLLVEPDTKGAVFKAENILREALAEAKATTHNMEFSSGRVPAVDESAGGCCPSAATQGYASANYGEKE